MSITPKKRPNVTKEQVMANAQWALDQLPISKFPIVFFGIPAGMSFIEGTGAKNKRGQYDDIICMLDRRPGGKFIAINGNCDPTAQYKLGLGCVVQPQILYFRRGLHRGREAFRQASTFRITRDGQGEMDAPTSRAFNFHDSLNPDGTSSLGCQTAPKEQFKEVKEAAYALTIAAGQDLIPYILDDFNMASLPIALPKSLSMGMVGNGTKELQKLLNAAGYDAGKEDDRFGIKTDTALRAYQKDNGLVVDGKAGTLTMAKLRGNKKGTVVESGSELEINAAGVSLIKNAESCKLKAYLCPAKKWTIGWGHTKGVKKGDVITQAEADKFFVEDMAEFSLGVKKLVSVPLNINQFSALVSFTFNVGKGAFATSTLREKLNAKDFAGAAEEFKRWKHADGKVQPGLVIRRAAEKALFLS